MNTFICFLLELLKRDKFMKAFLKYAFFWSAFTALAFLCIYSNFYHSIDFLLNNFSQKRLLYICVTLISLMFVFFGFFWLLIKFLINQCKIIQNDQNQLYLNILLLVNNFHIIPKRAPKK